MLRSYNTYDRPCLFFCNDLSITRQVMIEASTAKQRAALNLLRTALTGLGRLFCAETTAMTACDAFNTMTERAGRKGEQKVF